MKKVLSVMAVVLTLVVLSALFIGCSGSSDTLSVSSYEITETKYNVGDTIGTPTVTAKMSDGTTKTVSNHLVLKQSDVEALHLTDDKFTVAGEYTVAVYHLEEKEGYKLGDWKITVKATK